MGRGAGEVTQGKPNQPGLLGSGPGLRAASTQRPSRGCLGGGGSREGWGRDHNRTGVETRRVKRRPPKLEAEVGERESRAQELTHQGDDEREDV